MYVVQKTPFDKICYFPPQTFGLSLGPIQPPVQLPPGVKQSGHEADHSPPSGAEVNSVCGAIPLLPYMHASITCRGTTFTLQWSCLRSQGFIKVYIVSDSSSVDTRGFDIQ